MLSGFEELLNDRLEHPVISTSFGDALYAIPLQHHLHLIYEESRTGLSALTLAGQCTDAVQNWVDIGSIGTFQGIISTRKRSGEQCSSRDHHYPSIDMQWTTYNRETKVS